MTEGLATGAPATMILGQQFSHLSYAASGEGGLTGAFGQVASKLSFLLNPMVLAGAMAKGEGWRRSSLAHLVSRSPSFPAGL